MKVLAGRLLRLYPEHRWLGAEAAIDDALWMEACHHLASSSFQHMMSNTQNVPSHLPESAALPQNVPTAVPESMQHEASGSSHLARAVDPSIFLQDPNIVENAPGLSEHAQPGDVWQTINNKRAAVAREWLKGDPLPSLLALRLCFASPHCAICWAPTWSGRAMHGP